MLFTKCSSSFTINIINILSSIHHIETCYTCYKTESFHCFRGFPKLLFIFTLYVEVFSSFMVIYVHQAGQLKTYHCCVVIRISNRTKGIPARRQYCIMLNTETWFVLSTTRGRSWAHSRLSSQRYDNDSPCLCRAKSRHINSAWVNSATSLFLVSLLFCFFSLFRKQDFLICCFVLVWRVILWCHQQQGCVALHGRTMGDLIAQSKMVQPDTAWPQEEKIGGRKKSLRSFYSLIFMKWKQC